MRISIAPLLLMLLTAWGCAGNKGTASRSIQLETEPSNAVALVNGLERGHTPFTYTYDLNDGKRVDVEFRLDGHATGTVTLRPRMRRGWLAANALLLHIPGLFVANKLGLYELPVDSYRLKLSKRLLPGEKRQLLPVAPAGLTIEPDSIWGSINRKPLHERTFVSKRGPGNSSPFLSDEIVSGFSGTAFDGRAVERGQFGDEELTRKAGFAVQPMIQFVHADLSGSKNAVYGAVELKLEWRFMRELQKDSVFLTSPMTVRYQAMGERLRDVVPHALQLAARMLADDTTIMQRLNIRMPGAPSTSPANVLSSITLARPTALAYAERREMISTMTKAVVTVRTEDGYGSGFIITSDGYILTNEHVVGTERTVNVKFEQGFALAADVVRTDKDLDLALLKVNATDLPALTVGDDKSLLLGEDIYAIGTPVDISLGQTVTRGILSGRRIIEGRELLQTDVSINPGNSGGPLINEKGTVVGLATMKLRGPGFEGLGFGIPISVAFEALHIKYAE